MFAYSLLQGLTARQHELILLVQSFLRSERPDTPALADDEVAQATLALAETYETKSRGIIYDHKASLPSAERLAAEIKALVEKAREQGLKVGDADISTVLRRIEGAARAARAELPGDATAYIGFLRRILRDPGSAGSGENAPAAGGPSPSGESRLIVP